MAYDTLYSIRGEDYSPEGYGYVDAAQAVPEVASHAQSPMVSASPVLDAAVVPKPPNPAVGGLPGLSHALGWSTGLRNSRAFRQAFDGRTLVVSTMGVHPIEGPVGYSTRQDRLFYGAQALRGDGMSDNMRVAKGVSSLDPSAIALATAGNPNYV